MSNRDFHSTSTSSASRGGRTSSTGDVATAASELASEAVTKVRDAASETASTISGEVKQLLDQQVSGGASMVSRLASTTKRAADELDRESPQLAGVVRAVADRMEGLAGNLQDQKVDQLFRAASDFTRQQPALTFGLAALAGFFVMRTIKSTPNMSMASQPSKNGSARQSSGGSFHGNY